jgi:outer membrane receptor protein involved in Fe transport
LNELTLFGGFRYSYYSNAGSVETYKAGIGWSPDDELRFRATFNHAVRAPNVVELFTPRTLSSSGLLHDPCAGPNPVSADPAATEPNCERTGVSQAQYGNIAPSPIAYNALQGGNPNLKPESADTLTIGVVLSPRALEGVTLSIDYFDIDISGVTSTLDPDLAIEECLQTGSPFLCAFIHRAPGSGSLWLTADGYVSNLSENVSSLETRGVDVEIAYAKELPHWNGRNAGTVSFRFLGTYTNALVTTPEPGAVPYDCAGLYGAICGDPVPRWRHIARATWNSPWDFGVALTWRYISAIRIANSSANPNLSMPFDAADFQLGARSYLDLAAVWDVNRNWEVRAGVNNIFDRDPPVFGFNFAEGVASNANTYPGVYDALGRAVFVGLTYRR